MGPRCSTLSAGVFLAGALVLGVPLAVGQPPVDLNVGGSFEVLPVSLPSAHYAFAWNGTHGFLFGGASDKIVRLDPAGGALVEMGAKLPRPTSGGTAAVFENRIYLFNLGFNDCWSDVCGWTALADVLVYDPANDTLSPVAADLGAVRLDSLTTGASGPDGIYFVGLNGNEILSFDPRRRAFQAEPVVLPYPVEGPRLAWTGQAFYVTSYVDPAIRSEDSPGLMAYDPLGQRAWVPKTGYGPGPFRSGATGPGGAWNGTSLWVYGFQKLPILNDYRPFAHFDPVTERVESLDHGLAGAETARFAFWWRDSLYLVGWGGGCLEDDARLLRFKPGEVPAVGGLPPVPKMTKNARASALGGYAVELSLCQSTDLDGMILHGGFEYLEPGPDRSGFKSGFRLGGGFSFQPGTHAVNVSLWDDRGNYVRERMEFVIDDANPTVDLQIRVEDRTLFADASRSQDADGEILFWHWDWGDGTGDFGDRTGRINHTYKAGGEYKVKVAVFDDEEQTASLSRQVRIGFPLLGSPGSSGSLLAVIIATALTVAVGPLRRRR